MDELRREAHALLVRMALISYGGVQRLGGRRASESEHVGPPGEIEPMHETWGRLFEDAQDAPTLRALLDLARIDYDSHMRRQLAPDTAESLDELCERIVSDGWAVSAEECARAMLCTPTLVRRARLAAARHPETGYALPEPTRDPLEWARALDQAGLSVRQIEALTGIPKSTLHDRLSARA